jgi:hypothetical protein
MENAPVKTGGIESSKAIAHRFPPSADCFLNISAAKQLNFRLVASFVSVDGFPNQFNK